MLDVAIASVLVFFKLEMQDRLRRFQAIEILGVVG